MDKDEEEDKEGAKGPRECLKQEHDEYIARSF